MPCNGFSQTLKGFEGFEGETSHLGVTPSADFGRNGGKGVGVNGLGYMSATGWGVGLSYGLTVAFAFKNWSDKVWGGSVTLCEMYGLGGGIKARLALTAQKQLMVSSYDRWIGGLVVRAISTERLADDAWHFIALNWESGGSGALGTCHCDGPSAGAGQVSAYIGGRLVATYSDSSDLCPEDNPHDVGAIPDEDGCYPNLDPSNDLTGVRGFRVGVLSGFLNEERHMGFDDIIVGVGAISDAAALELTLNEEVLTELMPVPGPTNLAMVNEDPPDDAEGYNMTEVAEHRRDTYTVEPVLDTSGCPIALQLDARMRKTSTARWYEQLFCHVTGEEWTMYSLPDLLSYDPNTGAFANHHHLPFTCAPNQPDDGGVYVLPNTDWTWEKINNLEVGYSLFSSGVSLGTILEPATPMFLGE